VRTVRRVISARVVFVKREDGRIGPVILDLWTVTSDRPRDR